MNSKLGDFKNTNGIIGGKYKLKVLIGKGSFGQVFKAAVKGSETRVAVKLEKKLNPNPSLAKEATILSKLNGKFGFPSLIAYNSDQTYNYMVTNLLGPDLESLKKACGGKFTLKTTLMLADQILTRVEILHQCGYVHRDMKPQNLVMGTGATEKNVYLIDFGLSVPYQDSYGQHIKFKDRPGLVGTARYASINCHVGCELSRRDDLESIGYMLIYFLKGKLPWQNIKAASKQEKYSLIMHHKMNITPEALCKDLPEEFADYLKQVRKIEFQETPNYKGLRKIFRTLLIKKGYDCDYQYNWMKRQTPKDTKLVPFKLEPGNAGMISNIKLTKTSQNLQKAKSGGVGEEEEKRSEIRSGNENTYKIFTTKSDCKPSSQQEAEVLSISTNRSIGSNQKIENTFRDQENLSILNFHMKPMNNFLRLSTNNSRDESTRQGDMLRSFRDEASSSQEPMNRNGLKMKKQLSSITPGNHSLAVIKPIMERARTFKIPAEEDESEMSSCGSKYYSIYYLKC